MNLFTLNDVTIIFTSSFVYVCSAALTFYSIQPKSENAIKRRHHIISGSIYTIAGMIVGIILANAYKVGLVYLSVLYSVRVVLSILSLFVPIYSILDDNENPTKAEKNIAKQTRTHLVEQDNEKKRKVSRNKGENRIKTSKFVKKNEKEKSKKIEKV